MKKRNHLKEIAEIPRQNPVAKYARQFNKSAVFADKRCYRRKAKHAGREVFPIGLERLIGNTSRALPVSFNRPTQVGVSSDAKSANGG